MLAAGQAAQARIARAAPGSALLGLIRAGRGDTVARRRAIHVTLIKQAFGGRFEDGVAAKSDRNSARRRSRASARGPTNTDRQIEVTRAACEVFAVKGYSAASIQDVAQKVGVLKGSLYYYIDAKEDLLWRIVDDVHAQSTKILDRVLALDLEPIERIRIYISSHVEWYLNNVTEVGVFFRDWRHLADERLSITRSRRRGYEQVIHNLICAAQDHGDISPQLDVKYATLYVLAAVNAVPDWYRPAGEDSAARIADAFASMTLGVLTGTPRPAGSLPAAQP